jgi:ABC-type phosphate/phosphonate transport system substrate-binding protein
MKSMTIMLLICSAALAGCIEDTVENSDITAVDNCTGDELKIAYEVKEDATEIANPQQVADYLCEKLNMDVSLYDVGSSGLAMEALRFGNADIAMNIDGGPAWVGWNAYGLDVMAADTKSDGRAFYNAHAWVKNGSDIAEAYLDDDNSTDPFSLMEGKTSCHTGWLKSAGMLMPMGYLIGNGYVTVAGDMSDTETLRTTINNYFDGSKSGGNAASIPASGALYSGYDGALECLSSGYGDVAFAKDSTPGSYCGNEIATENEAWCLPMNEYIALPKFGSSPSHAVMYNDAVLDDAKEVLIRDALVAMKDDLEGLEILTNVLGTSAMIATDTDAHLGTYGATLMNIPGISSKYGNAFSDGTATGAVKSTINIAYYLADDGSTNANAQGMADRLASDLGVNVNLYDVSSEGMIIQALRFGSADLGFMEGGPAWIGWKQYGLSTLAVETTTSQGDTYYNASAWVLKGTDVANAALDGDESTDPFALLAGKTSCHTGWLKSAGMLMPMGYLIGNGYVTPVGDASDINSLRLTIDAHFDGSNSNGNAASIPDSGALYSSYDGAVECLSSGYGDVAFAKGDDFSTVAKYCDNANASDNQAWCLEIDQYVQLPSFGQSPSHPVMYNADLLDVYTRNAILNAMLNWGDEMWIENYSMAGQSYTGCYNSVTHQVADIPLNQCGDEILSSVTSKGYKLNAGNSQNHLGSYSSLLDEIPGLSQYYHAEKYGISAAETSA